MEGRQNNPPMSTLLSTSNNNRCHVGDAAHCCHCETADVAGGHQPEEKTAVRLLVEMNSEQRQEGRRRRERGREGGMWRGSVRLL